MNNLQELRATLLQMHEKDKKQIITALLVAEAAALLFLWLVAANLLNNSSNLPGILYVMLALLVLGPVIPYVIMLVQAAKRPQRIEDLVHRLEQGEAVNNINTYTDYKLILPLRLIRIRMFPMAYVQMMITPSRLAFKLPLSEEHVQPFKAFVSRSLTDAGPSAGWSAV